MNCMNINLKNCAVRSWRKSDAESVAKYANNRKIWINLRDGFPHPYYLEHAHAFIDHALRLNPETLFAIDFDGEAIGSIGFAQHSDVERISAEIGYWLGEPFWNKGIMTEALKAVTSYAIEKRGLTRVFAVPFEWNQASCRVLEKAGYALEGRMRRSVIKDGKIIDSFLYAYITAT